jgi:hypothetical protein
LASKDSILFNQVRQGTSLLAIQPASQDREHHLDSRRLDHGRSLYRGVRLALFPSRRPDCGTLRGGGFTYSTANGTVLRVGFYGYANSRVPLFMNQTIGGGEDLTLPLVSFTDLSQQQMQWVLTAGIEKTFVTIPGIATIGGVADVVIPLNTVTPTITTPNTQTPASPMVRGGVKIGF